MIRYRRLLFVATFFLHSLVAKQCTKPSYNACALEPVPNLGIVKKHVYSYFTSGTYEKEIKCIAKQIKKYLLSFYPVQEKYAVIFDIDDTLLSTFFHNKEQDWGYNKDEFLKWELTAQAPAIKIMKDIYNFVQKKGFSIFLITGRQSELKEATTKNLYEQGYCPCKGIFFRWPEQNHAESRVPFKSATRKKIEEKGYTIVANIGDQISDLEGGYSLKTFKLPNPMYFIP